MGSVEADERLAHSSSTNTATPCPGDIGGPSELAYTRPALGRPASAAQYAVDVKVLDHTSWCQSQSAQRRSEHVAIWCTTRIMLQ